ncbi:MAG: 5-formyltetrahydrofolate cyclo-ligase [Oscillospiraceae bacterium]|jgi:5-formyltetrahydrofolate cyclo-ligase|nr:5-formyltetrahydrofolate cyclo-ligase [Oscillospiraceae bacterium]
MTDTNKKALREELMARESAFSPDYIAESNAGIAANLLALTEYRAAKTILFFYSIWSEPDTHAPINAALAQGKTVCLPESLPRGIMVARKIGSLDELVPARYNIPSPTAEMPEILPQDIDLIIVPSVAFDADGYRLGHGGGYYDRYLPRSRAFRCGVAREQMLLPRVPRDEFDVAVDCLVTESRVLRF